MNDDANLKSAEASHVDFNPRDFKEFLWMNVTTGQGGKSIIFNTSTPQPEPYHNDSAGSMYFEVNIFTLVD